MRRREVLQGLFCLSASGILNACREPQKSDRDETQHENENPATLKVILQGPFAVVLKNQKGRFSVSAFIPPDPEHEFRFQTPAISSLEKSAPKYQFTLAQEGLEVNANRHPYIDHGLDDTNFNLGPYPEPNAFVSVELPAPDFITFIPPTEPVVFEGGKLAFAPLNHVLEYRVREASKLRLGSPQFKEAIRPLAFSELFKQYQQHIEREQDYKDKPGHGPQSSRTRSELEQPQAPEVYTYFFGVGLPPSKAYEPDAIRHGLDFFNKKLVPLFPNSKDLKPLVEIRNYGQPCTPTGKPAPTGLKPAIFQSGIQQPRLRLVTSAEDCRAPGLSGSCC